MAKATDRQLLDAYAELGSVHKVGERFGMRGTSAHERLAKLGVVKPINHFTDAERDRLRAEYQVYRNHGRLRDLAESMGRTVPFLSRKARELGLTDPSHPKRWAKWEHMTEEAAALLFDAFKASSCNLAQWCAKNGYDDEGFRRIMQRYFGDEWEHVIESKAHRSSAYRLGRQVEYRVRDHLRRNGYVAIRSPASKSPVDIVAIKPGQVLMVQCKRSGSLPPAEWNALYDLAMSCGAVPVMAETPWPRELRFHRLTARKDGSRRRQPMEPFVIDEVVVAPVVDVPVQGSLL